MCVRIYIVPAIVVGWRLKAHPEGQRKRTIALDIEASCATDTQVARPLSARLYCSDQRIPLSHGSEERKSMR